MFSGRNPLYIRNKYEDAVGKPIYEESTRQINELYQKGLIGKPDYELDQDYGGEGRTDWSCTLKVNGYQREFYGYGSNQKESKRDAAYDFLCFIMGVDEDDYE